MKVMGVPNQVGGAKVEWSHRGTIGLPKIHFNMYQFVFRIILLKNIFALTQKEMFTYK